MWNWNETATWNETALLTGRFIVSGSDGLDGVYIASMSDAYYQSGENYLVKRQLAEWEGWVLASGPSLETAQVIYRSNNSDEEVPMDGWHTVVNETELEEKNLKTILVPEDSVIGNQVMTKDGFLCKAFRPSDKWIWFPGNGTCDSHCECSTGFLVVRGPSPKYNGVYEVNDRSVNFFNHSQWIIYKKNESWVLGVGPTPANAGQILFNSTGEKEDIPETGWRDKLGRLVDTMRVNQVTKAFTREEMLHGEKRTDEGLVCQGTNNQRLFITMTGGDPFDCNGRYDCKSREDERSCSFLVDMSMEKPILTSLFAVAVGIVLFCFIKCIQESRRDSSSVSDDLENPVNLIIRGILHNMNNQKLNDQRIGLLPGESESTFVTSPQGAETSEDRLNELKDDYKKVHDSKRLSLLNEESS